MLALAMDSSRSRITLLRIRKSGSNLAPLGAWFPVYGLAVVMPGSIGHRVAMSQGVNCIRFGRLQLLLGVI